MSKATANDRVLLDQTLQQRQDARITPLDDSYAFELLACELALKEYDLSTDEIEEGIVGGGQDGGIDGIYVFYDGALLSEDSEIFQDGFTPPRGNGQTQLELWLVQAKRTESFGEDAIDKLSVTCSHILDLAPDETALRTLYSQAVIDRSGYFRSALKKLVTKHPNVVIRFVYAARGDASKINKRVKTRANNLKKQFENVVTSAVGEVEFLGASELWARAIQTPNFSLSLTCLESATGDDSYVALVSLKNYLEFLTNQSGNLNSHIFDWNVRDYQGGVEVNKEIQESLQNVGTTDFWWLNNGVTVTCSKASLQGKTFQLDDVQVVNGLQTSHSIFKVLSKLPKDTPVLSHSVLVRILVTNDLSTRDKIIRATNSQTKVPDASLRATDPIQRNIEEYFLANGWFYDRRKNYYKNQGKSADRIVSIPFLAQAMLAIGFSRPDHSRARPSSLIKEDTRYKDVFSDSTPLVVYLWVALSQKSVESFLLSLSGDVTVQERTNLKYYISMIAAAGLAGKKVNSPQQLVSIANDNKQIEEADLSNCLEVVRAAFKKIAEDTGDSSDKIAKNQATVERVLQLGLRAKSSAKRKAKVASEANMGDTL